MNKKKAEVVILICDKVDFRARKVTRNKERNYIMMIGSIHGEDTTILNRYAPKKRDSNYKKEKVIKLKDK